MQNDLADVLIELPDYERAANLLASAITANRRHAGTQSAQVARNLLTLANLNLKTGQLGAATDYARSGIDIYEQLGPDYAVRLAQAKALLGRILQTSGDLKQTEALLNEAIEIIARSEGDDYPSMAYYLQNLAVLQRSQGDLTAARATFERAVEAIRRILGEQHPAYADTLMDLGGVLHMQGDLGQGGVPDARCTCAAPEYTHGGPPNDRLRQSRTGHAAA